MNANILKTIVNTTKGRFFTVISKRKDGSTLKVNGKVVVNAKTTKGHYITVYKAKKAPDGSNEFAIIDCSKFKRINFDGNKLEIS